MQPSSLSPAILLKLIYLGVCFSQITKMKYNLPRENTSFLSRLT